MARPQVTGRKLGGARASRIEHDNDDDDDRDDEAVPRLALSILQFCEAHSISEDFYYKLKRQNQGPDEMKVGARRLISIESAAAWRKAREAATRKEREATAAAATKPAE